MKKNGLWVIAFVIVALMVLTSVSPLSTNRTETIDNSTYIISNTPPDNPELGDLWFDTTLDEMNIYNGYVWQSLVPTVSGAGYSNHAGKHAWGSVDPISFQELSPNVRVASEYATSGSGTEADPWIGAIKNAIADISSSDIVSEHGGTIYIPKGYYELYKIIGKTAAIWMDGSNEYPKVNLVGESPLTTILTLADNQDCDMISITPINLLAYLGGISNLKLAGNKANQASGKGIYIHANAGDARIINCYINECEDDSVDINGWDYIVAKNAIEQGGDSGIKMGGHSGFIFGNYVMNHVDSGIVIDGQDHTITNNRISSLSNYGIFLQRADRCTIHHNRISDWDRGDSGTKSGIVLYGVSGDCVRNTIDHNILTTSKVGKYGIQIGYDNTDTGVDNNTINANSIQDPSSGAIYVYPNVLQNNQIFDNFGYVNEKHSSSTITNGNTHVTVTHEMDVTPTSITVTGNHSEVSACWVVNITATQFEIWVSSAVTYDRIVYWYAEAR